MQDSGAASGRASEEGVIDIPISKFSFIHKEGNGKPSQAYCEITLQHNSTSSIELESLIFQNYYTAVISISQHNGSTYTTILDRMNLMKDPYAENDATNWKVINVKDFNNDYVKNKPLRITLIQPCSYWQKFEIRHLRAVGRYAHRAYHADAGSNSSDVTIDFYKSGFSQFINQDYRILQLAAQEQSTLLTPPSPIFNAVESKRSTKKKEKKKEKRLSISAINSDQQSNASSNNVDAAKPLENLMMTP